jgi:peptidoglycan/xylan/chitin deacetylase (PgdA/CDA1 family)
MGIRRFFNEISRPVSMINPLSILVHITRQHRILPCYHAVSDKPLPHLKHVLNIRNEAAFNRDLDFFLKHFRPVDAHELWKGVREGSAIKHPVFHLSFDDGLKECVTIIAPILKSRGIPATFFINTGFIGNQEIFYRFKVSLLIEIISLLSATVHKTIHTILDKSLIPEGGLEKRLLSVTYAQKEVLEVVAVAADLDFGESAASQEIYMNEEDIHHLLEQGFTVGAHSIDHPLFSTVNFDEQLRQTSQSMENLRDWVQVSPLMFSFPFSDDEVTAAFYHRIHQPEGIVDLSFGISGLKKDILPAHLHRIPMETGAYSAEQIITGEYLYFMMKSIIHKNKISRK